MMRLIIAGYVCAGLIVAFSRNRTLVTWVFKFIRDFFVWPYFALLQFFRKPGSNEDGGTVTIQGGQAKGKGRGGDVLLRVGDSSAGPPGILRLENIVLVDGRPCIMVNGKKYTFPEL